MMIKRAPVPLILYSLPAPFCMQHLQVDIRSTDGYKIIPLSGFVDYGHDS